MESLNIRAITWNVEGTNKPEDFDCSQLLGFDHQNVDVFVVGFQEMSCRVEQYIHRYPIQWRRSMVKGYKGGVGWIRFCQSHIKTVLWNSHFAICP